MAHQLSPEELRQAERNELFRIAAQRLIDDHQNGRKVDKFALAWARRIVERFKPLGRPLSAGDTRARVSDPMCAKCGRPGHLAKDCKWPAAVEAA